MFKSSFAEIAAELPRQVNNWEEAAQAWNQHVGDGTSSLGEDSTLDPLRTKVSEQEIVNARAAVAEKTGELGQRMVDVASVKRRLFKLATAAEKFDPETDMDSEEMDNVHKTIFELMKTEMIVDLYDNSANPGAANKTRQAKAACDEAELPEMEEHWGKIRTAFIKHSEKTNPDDDDDAAVPFFLPAPPEDAWVHYIPSEQKTIAVTIGDPRVLVFLIYAQYILYACIYNQGNRDGRMIATEDGDGRGSFLVLDHHHNSINEECSGNVGVVMYTYEYAVLKAIASIWGKVRAKLVKHYSSAHESSSSDKTMKQASDAIVQAFASLGRKSRR